MPALQAVGVSVSFGGRKALESVHLTLARGEILGLIGTNGAGKSTLLGVLGGSVAPDQGQVFLGGQSVLHLGPTGRARLGVGRVFQDARLFAELTVLETVLVACESSARSELVPALLGLPPDRRAERHRQEISRAVLSDLGLEPYADRQIARLSTGMRRVVELACLLVQQADVLLLDEPTAGLAQREAEEFGPLLAESVREMGASAVLVEHDLPLVLSVSDRVQCLAGGRTIAEGPPAEIREDDAVLASFLGSDPRTIERSRAPKSPAPKRRTPKRRKTASGRGGGI